MDNKSYQDFYFKKAKIKGYRSRSAFKLIELNQKFKFLKKGIKLLDVGSFPGGWCQVVSQNVKKGRIMAVDKKKIINIKDVKIIEGDFLDENTEKKILKFFNSKIDVILSDMAPNTSGNKSLDSIRTNELCLSILKFSKSTLDKNGVVISKLFMGEDFEEIKAYAKKTFKKINFFKPNSSRDNSRETYIHCNRLNS
ncbi:MAG: 50S rRNA methyltransferase [Candidatus Pelagibacter sp. TMED196]|nr:MAG: 50S rRNA methyltransferase [Candidatus Pelagibacter sp. TMED196]|tara:strand:+ start:717 stop:1304 length:588 start_codon:yes stop_codon:yes gene_type:complete